MSPGDPGIVVPELLIDGKPFRKSTDFTFFPGLNIETERQLYYERHQAVLAYARANSLSWAEIGARGDRVGLVTAGKSYADVRQALDDLGLDERALRRLGVRLLQRGAHLPARRRRDPRLRARTWTRSWWSRRSAASWRGR